MRRVVCLAVTMTALAAGVAQAAVPTTYQDFAYTSTVTSNPTADKPQSKLWFQDGSWWSLMLSPSDNVVHIFELRADHTWRDTGTVVDSRSNSTGDALWTRTRTSSTWHRARPLRRPAGPALLQPADAHVHR
jgi:hypothetical protein